MYWVFQIWRPFLHSSLKKVDLAWVNKFSCKFSVFHSEVVSDKFSVEEESTQDIDLNKFKEDLSTGFIGKFFKYFVKHLWRPVSVYTNDRKSRYIIVYLLYRKYYSPFKCSYVELKMHVCFLFNIMKLNLNGLTGDQWDQWGKAWKNWLGQLIKQ